MTYALVFKIGLTVAIVAALAGFMVPTKHTIWWKGLFLLAGAAEAVVVLGALWMLP